MVYKRKPVNLDNLPRPTEKGERERENFLHFLLKINVQKAVFEHSLLGLTIYNTCKTHKAPSAS